MRDRELVSSVLESNDGFVSCVSLIADETKMVSESRDRTVWLWQMRNARRGSTLLEGHTGPVTFVLVRPKRTLFLCVLNDESMQV